MKTLGDAAVGDVVYMRVSGEYTPFRVMHKGWPGEEYDEKFNGCTVLSLDYNAQPFVTQIVSDPGAKKGTYASSYMHRALHQIWFPRLDPAMRDQVVEVRLSHRVDTDGTPYTVHYNTQGLAAKVWLPSLEEAARVVVYDTGIADAYVKEGQRLDYWAGRSVSGYRVWGCSDSRGQDIGWGTRIPAFHYGDHQSAPYFYKIRKDGSAVEAKDNQITVRPWLVMPDTVSMDNSNYLHLEGSAQVKVNGVWKEGTVACKHNGVWREADAVAARIGGVWKE